MTKSSLSIVTFLLLAQCTPTYSNLAPLDPAKAKKLAEYTVLVHYVEKAFEEDIKRIEMADTTLTKPTVKEWRYASKFTWYVFVLKPLYAKREALRNQYTVLLEKMIAKIQAGQKNKAAFKASLATDTDFAALKEIQKEVVKHCYEDILTIL